MTIKNSVYLGLGSNIGDKLLNLKNAIQLIKNIKDTKIEKISPVYKTPPVGYEKQDFFLNCVVLINTVLLPEDLLKNLQSVEIKLGRKRLFKWGPRTIDIDILFFNNEIIDSDNLKVPHPYIQNRAFVLLPFNDINSDFIHPLIKKNIKTLLSELPVTDFEGIEKLSVTLFDKL